MSLRKINNELKSYVNEASFVGNKCRNKLLKMLGETFDVELPLENFAKIDAELTEEGNIIMRGDEYKTSSPVKTEEELIKVLNPKITGWRNYYKTRNDRKWMRAIDWYILCTFCRWNNKKRQQTRKLKGLYATKIRLQEKGLQLMAA